MKKYFSPGRLFIAGFFLVLAANAVIIGGVAYNRSGEPDAVITLTERELQVTRSYRPKNEDSGMSLRVEWRALGKMNRDDSGRYYPDWRTPAWLDSGKLDELGFDMERYSKKNYKSRSYRDMMSRKVFVVLENNGESYREAVRRAEEDFTKAEAAVRLNPEKDDAKNHLESAEKEWLRENESESRLFVIDAGLDAGRLREKYSDRTRYIVTRATIKPRYHYSYSKDNKEELLGTILNLDVEKIHVSLEQRAIIESAESPRSNMGYSETEPPDYSVELVYGRLFEPWVKSVKELGR